MPRVKHLLPLEAPAAIANLIRKQCENLSREETPLAAEITGQGKLSGKIAKKSA